MRSPLKASVTIAISIALATILGGCSLLPLLAAAPTPTPTPTGQSVGAACEELDSELEHVKTEMQQAAELLNTETAAAADLLFVSAFRLKFMADEEIENEEVIEVTLAASESITVLSDLLKEAAADPTNADTEAIDAAGDHVNAAFDALDEVCPTGESASAACDALEGEATAVNAEMSVASDLLSTDPTGAAKKLAAAAVRFDEAAAAVENENVSELATDTSDSLNAFSELINVLAADPDNPDEDALTAGSTDLNAAFNDLVTLCDW